jgi:hypothetical protein
MRYETLRFASAWSNRNQADQIYCRQHHDLADIERVRAARKPIGNLQHHPERDDEAERRRYGGKDEKAFHADRPWLLILAQTVARRRSLPM